MASIKSVNALMAEKGVSTFSIAIWQSVCIPVVSPNPSKEKGSTMASERSWKCKNDGCNATVVAYGGYDTECPTCDQPYNAFGQRLRDDWAGNPSNWNDDIGDMEGYEIQHADSY